MELRMIKYGMLAGFGFLLAVAVLEWLTRPGAVRPVPGAALEGEISTQVWQVLAEARRILEESA